jgi:hypothetical protein
MDSNFDISLYEKRATEAEQKLLQLSQRIQALEAKNANAGKSLPNNPMPAGYAFQDSSFKRQLLDQVHIRFSTKQIQLEIQNDDLILLKTCTI